MRSMSGPNASLADWTEAIELAHNWKGYWEDDPIVHMDTAQVGFLARSFLFAMAHFGVIARPTSAGGSPKEGF